MKKHQFTIILMGLIYILTSALFISCSNNDDEPELEPEETDMISWSDVEGFYATKPEKQDLGTSWSTYYSAHAIKIEQYVLTDCGSIDNSDLVDGVIDSYCTELKGDWYSDMLNWEIYGLDINGNEIDVLYSDGWPTYKSIAVHKDYVEYNGRTYYTASYFNQHVDEWTEDSGSGNGGGTTPPQNENVSVSISTRTISSNGFARKYEITVKATGENFTVQQIGLERVSGIFVPTSYYTSAHQHTFTETYTSSSPSTIRGYVKTTSGNTYKSNTVKLSK